MSIIYGEQGEPIIQIANEFTLIQVTYGRTGSGERLIISSPRLRFKTSLDPLQLESLTWQTSLMYSKLLETPYGPGSELKASPLSELFERE